MPNILHRCIVTLSIAASFILRVSAALPAAPENVRPSWLWSPVPSSHEVMLTWDVVPEATGYNVYRWDDSAQAWTAVAGGLTVPRYRHDPPPPLPAHYVVTAVNGDGEGASSVEAIVDEGDFNNYITAPWPGLYPGTLTSTSAWISWYVSHVSGAEGMVDLSTNGTDYLTVYHQTNYQQSHSLWVTNLTPLTIYWYRLTTISTNRVGLVYTNFFATEDSNHPPVATSLSLSTYMAYPLDVPLSGSDNASYVPDMIETFRIIEGPTNGTLSGTLLPAWNNATDVIYTPSQNRPFEDHFWYVANDGELDSAPALVTITNIYYNRLPEGAYTNYATTNGIAIPIALAGYDPDGDAVTFALDTNYTSIGTVTGPLTNLLYTPPPGFVGQDYVFYDVSDDGMITWITGLIVIDVLSTNIAPVASSQSLTLAEDSSQTITLTAQDANGDTLTFLVTTQPAHGSLTGTPPLLTYTPSVNYSGSDAFSFRVNDGQVDSAIATVSLTVAPVNDPPVAYGGTVTTLEDTAVTFTLQASDVEGNPLTYWVAPPTNGILSGSGASRTFTPSANWNGTDILRFRVNDGSAWSDLVAVTIVVSAVNDPPQFVPQSLTTPEDTPVAFVPTVIEPDGEAYSITVLSAPTNGWMEASGAGYLYHPNTNATGLDRIVFSVTETNNPQGVQIGPPATVVGVITVNVTPVNDTPIANAQSISLAEDTARSITLTGYDVESATLTYSLLSSPTHGTLTGTPPNLNYTPAANYHGPDSFTFRVNDGAQFSAAATVSITVTPVNDPPTASGASYTLPEDYYMIFGTSGNDLDGDPLTHIITIPPAHGTLTPYGTSGNNWTYRPSLDYNGQDSFTFVVNDGTVSSAPATVLFTITPRNDMPWITNQSVTTPEDTAINITPLAGDVDGDSLTFVLFTPPAHGSVSINGGQLTYTPAANYNGPDSFEYQGQDPNGGSNTGLISVTVTPVNDAPIANPQSITVNEDVNSPTITLTGSDPEGSSLVMTIVNPPSHGTLSGTPPYLTYLSAANYNGPDSFTFKVSDGALESAPATVSITVVPVNDAPSAAPQTLGTAEDTPLSLVLSGTDVDGDPLTYVIASSPAHGSLSGTAPNVVYTPAPNYNGPDSFTFKVRDGALESAPATVSITLVPVNDTPSAAPQTLSTVEDAPLSLTLTGTDVDGDALTYVIATGPAHGSLTGTAPNMVYTPAPDYNGPDSFTFRVDDGTVSSVPATISITVTPVNDAPVANGQALTTPYNAPITVTLTGTDAEGTALTYTVLSSPANGTLSGTAPNLIFTPNIGSSGTTSFTFKVNDGGLDSAAATVTITVQAATAVPSAPSGLMATAVSKSEINLAWTDNANSEDGFKIERSTNGSTWTQIGTVTRNVTSYSSTGLSANKIYYYRVRAYNVLGNSAYSATASAKTLK